MKSFIQILFLIGLAAPVFSQNDLNFRFYPSDNYLRYKTYQAVTDTVTKATAWKNDSTLIRVRGVVEKNGADFKIYSTTDLTATHYETKVKFVGVTTDGAQCLVYTGSQGETILCNPIKGFVIIRISTNCEDPTKIPANAVPRCDVVWHVFGDPFPGYRP